MTTREHDIKNSRRLRSLDVFRGLNIAAMILVNMTWDRDALPGQMFHVGWNSGQQGASFTDLVFPWFIFIAGVSIPFSMRSGRGRTSTRPQKIYAAFRRALLLYTLGLTLDAATSGQFVFFKWNILQMIAGAYFLAVLAAMLPLAAQIAFVVCLLATKWYVLSIYVIPGQTASVWHFEAGGNVVADRYTQGVVAVNGEQHFKSRFIAMTPSWPVFNWLTNAFNLLPAAAVGIMGSWTGAILWHRDNKAAKRAAALLFFGLAGWLLSWFWNLHHPWSKDFFTASYALLSAATGAGLLAALYLLLDTDTKHIDRAGLIPAVIAVLMCAAGLLLEWPLAEWVVGLTAAGLLLTLLARFDRVQAAAVVLGMNAIAIYFVNELLIKMVFSKWTLPVFAPDKTMLSALYSWFRTDWATSSTLDLLLGSWAFAIFWLSGCWLFAWILHKKQLYLRV